MAATANAVQTIEDLDMRFFTPQRPYRNGVTVHRYSIWGGNGFGTAVQRYAFAADGTVVGYYANGEGGAPYAVWVLVDGQRATIMSDGYFHRGERIVTKTALQKWVEAVKAMTPATA